MLRFFCRLSRYALITLQVFILKIIYQNVLLCSVAATHSGLAAYTDSMSFMQRFPRINERRLCGKKASLFDAKFYVNMHCICVSIRKLKWSKAFWPFMMMLIYLGGRTHYPMNNKNNTVAATNFPFSVYIFYPCHH